MTEPDNPVESLIQDKERAVYPSSYCASPKWIDDRLDINIETIFGIPWKKPHLLGQSTECERFVPDKPSYIRDWEQNLGK